MPSNQPRLIAAPVVLGLLSLVVASCKGLDRTDGSAGPPQAVPLAPTGGPIFGQPQGNTFLFPGKREDLDVSVYWQVTYNHVNAHARDMKLVRFDRNQNRWRSGPSIGTPVYAMADGEVFSCWRNAPDGPDPGRDGCDDADCEDFDECSCTTPAGGNHVRIRTADNQTLFHAHLKQGTVPREICPIELVALDDARDKSGPYELNPQIVVPADQRVMVEAGEYIGDMGNSGQSSGPHLHIHMRQCGPNEETDDCPGTRPLHLTGARVAEKPEDRDVLPEEWVPLNGTLAVSFPRTLVRPEPTGGGVGIPGGTVNTQPTNRIELTQVSEDASATIVVDAIDPSVPVSAFDWERIDPSLTQLGFDATINWRVSASCAEGIDRVTMASPGGSEVETFSGQQFNASGEFQTQSFNAEALGQLCLDWAQSVSGSSLCNQAPELCPSHEEFDVTGGVTANLDEVVEVTLRCQDGTFAFDEGRAELNLLCGAAAFGFPH